MEKEKRSRLFYSAFPWIAFLMIMWIFYFANEKYDLHYSTYGVYPREWFGLKGILFYPFIHGSFEHLINNSLPLLILGTALYFFYGKLGLKVSLILYFLSGILVWLSGRPSYHIGASGLIYAIAGFLFMSGILRREKGLVALSLLVAFLYGGLFWGIFPIKESISWEGHLWGGLSGMVLAWYYRKEGPQRKRYDWEYEEYDHEADSEFNEGDYEAWKQHHTRQTPVSKISVRQVPKQRIVIKYDYKESSKDDPKKSKD